MKIAMMGTGGVGGYYGVRLAQAGHEVVFIARGAHAEAMRRDGLRIESEHGPARLQPVRVVSDPHDAGHAGNAHDPGNAHDAGKAHGDPNAADFDLVVIAVKLWDTDAAARAILPLVGAATAVVSLQNGIDKDDTIAGIVGPAHLLGGLTYISVVVSAPGVVTQTGRMQRVILGEIDGSLSARAEAAGAAFRSAGIDTEVTPDIRRAIWEKFIFLAAHSATTAATRQPIGRVRAHPASRAMLEDALREGMALAAAEGIALGDDFLRNRFAFIDAMAPESRASMAQDLARGNRLELDWLSGAILRRAERHGLATPVHRTLYAALALYAGGSPSPSP
jgi:2-dehydropantoate 2-reductase